MKSLQVYLLLALFCFAASAPRPQDSEVSHDHDDKTPPQQPGDEEDQSDLTLKKARVEIAAESEEPIEHKSSLNPRHTIPQSHYHYNPFVTSGNYYQQPVPLGNLINIRVRPGQTAFPNPLTPATGYIIGTGQHGGSQFIGTGQIPGAGQITGTTQVLTRPVSQFAQVIGTGHLTPGQVLTTTQAKPGSSIATGQVTTTHIKPGPTVVTGQVLTKPVTGSSNLGHVVGTTQVNPGQIITISGIKPASFVGAGQTLTKPIAGSGNLKQVVGSRPTITTSQSKPVSFAETEYGQVSPKPTQESGHFNPGQVFITSSVNPGHFIETAKVVTEQNINLSQSQKGEGGVTGQSITNQEFHQGSGNQGSKKQTGSGTVSLSTDYHDFTKTITCLSGRCTVKYCSGGVCTISDGSAYQNKHSSSIHHPHVTQPITIPVLTQSIKPSPYKLDVHPKPASDMKYNIEESVEENVNLNPYNIDVRTSVDKELVNAASLVETEPIEEQTSFVSSHMPVINPEVQTPPLTSSIQQTNSNGVQNFNRFLHLNPTSSKVRTVLVSPNYRRSSGTQEKESVRTRVDIKDNVLTPRQGQIFDGNVLPSEPDPDTGLVRLTLNPIFSFQENEQLLASRQPSVVSTEKKKTPIFQFPETKKPTFEKVSVKKRPVGVPFFYNSEITPITNEDGETSIAADYGFSYSVPGDEFGHGHGHVEQGTAGEEGTRVSGMYYVNDEQGNRRVIHYTADERGFIPVLSHEAATK